MQARRLMRYLRGGAIGLELVAKALSVSLPEAEERVRLLLEEGYLEPCPDEGQRYQITRKGSALAMATAARPVKRATAERILQEFLSRVHEVNNDDRFVYKVTKVIVFGSFLGSTPTLGDLDLAIELQPGHENHERQRELEQTRIRAARAKGRRFANFVDELYWPRQEVRLFLKGRSRTISLHFTSDGILKSARHEVLYEQGAQGGGKA